MSQRIFQLRSSIQYAGEANEVTALKVELFHDGTWIPFDLNVQTPGFLIFVYAIFTCQHLYLRVNAAESGILLDSASGQIVVGTSQDWNLEDIDVTFDCTAHTGLASAANIAYIIERMKACPVSLNIRKDVDIAAKVTIQLKHP